MNPSTKDEIQGTVHEVKGKVKETAGKVTNNPNLQAEGNVEKIPAKLRKRSDRSKKCSRSKEVGSPQSTFMRAVRLMYRRFPLQ
jgi:uncharacterized protein YjbJ (UPF0337 family)